MIEFLIFYFEQMKYIFMEFECHSVSHFSSSSQRQCLPILGPQWLGLGLRQQRTNHQ